ncbi:hypothetical protein SAMN02745123_00944 [Desulforamulus aeronauticus DSM 10349]|uniref:Uncharacterized protein n=1 Tax=Desulforamulus aeronauticus DSM 10349 TaxID=1121421 RepID=A0A1M6QBD8_9FIRM|nr:hypothetical protein SAMN02745123_00944 [Desulforamulus aeronauticus DSM 10349]
MMTSREKGARHRRKSDKYSKSLIAMTLFSLAVIFFSLTKI